MRKVVKATLFVLALFFIGMNANAQYASSSSYSSNVTDGGWRLGLKLGPNFAGFTGKGADGLNGRVGVHAGMFAEYVMPTNLFIQTGLELTLKGAKYSYSDRYEDVKVTANPVYLQVPIHVGCQLMLADNMNVNVHVGPYLAYGIAGKWKTSYDDDDDDDYGYDYDDDDESMKFFGSEEDGGCKAFDFGLGFGIDLDISLFRLGLGYDAGLVNIGRDGDYPMRNRNFYITLGYKF
ncbi:MAG: PorT family protein [Tannerellaceae bacterium]|nr:PorT family protein [Tannerellaceae bacterium]